MNHDHLLTRVFDKKEKEMMYAGSQYGQITDKGFYGVLGHVFNPFGTRFIPLLCTGYRDKNKNLMYEHDIIKTSSGNEYVVERYHGMFIANGINEPMQLHHFMNNLTVEISGNVHEHLNPLKKESNNEQ